jgi:hypothetical protein
MYRIESMTPYWNTVLKIPGIPTLISAILGFGLAALFRPMCEGPDCIIVRGPPVNDIRGAVYQFGERCVEFITKPVECPKSGSVKVVDTVSFAEYTK